MQAAFFFVSRFPPPAPGPHIFAGADGAGAGRAADARIALRVQRIDRHLVLPDVGFDIGQGPFEQRIEFGQVVLCVKRHFAQVRARCRLFAAQAGDPGALAGQGAAERLDLAHGAAILALGHTVIKTVDAVEPDVVLKCVRLWNVDRDAFVVVRFGRRQQCQGFRMQASGVERKWLDRWRVFDDQVDQHHVFETEAGRKDGGGAGLCLFEQRDGVCDGVHGRWGARSGAGGNFPVRDRREKGAVIR